MGRMRHVGVMGVPALFLALVMFALPLATAAQPARRIPRLCFLTFDPGTLLSRSTRFDAFFEGLRDTFPRTGVVSDFPLSLPNVCVLTQTSSP